VPKKFTYRTLIIAHCSVLPQQFIYNSAVPDDRTTVVLS